MTMASVIPFKRDIYCWICHMESPLLKCKNCPRAFHRHCAYNMPNYPDPYFDPEESSTPNMMDDCPECCVAKNTNLPNMKGVTKNELRTILTYVSKNLKDGYYWPNPFYKLQQSAIYGDVIAKFMDISTLESMVHYSQFSTLEGFLGEVKWILHNTIVHDGRSSTNTESAKEVMRLCKIELMAVDLCPECYCREQERDHDPLWFVQPCLVKNETSHRMPHVIGWAKTPGAPYWPVKIMQIQENIVTVRSFADYRRYDIPAKNCYLFSVNPPTKYKGKRRDAYQKALTEVKLHISELKNDFGRVDLAEDGTPLGVLSLPDAVNRMLLDLKSKDNPDNNNNV